MTNRPDSPITTGTDAARVAVAELRAQLADRERQLAALTEQSLRILDELAEARRNPPDKPEVATRLASLEEMLRDARHRIRLGTRAVLGVQPKRPEDLVHEIVLWDVPAHPHAELERAGRVFELAPVAVLAGPDHRIEDFQLGHETWSVFETPCRRPAHFWNEAMTLVEEGAEVVVFVAAGVELDAAALDALVSAANVDGVALASPLLLVGEQHFLGRTEQGLMDVRAQPVRGDAESTTLSFASPECFAISRRAYETVGPFDQDLVGDLALAEWTARAQAHALRCVGATAATAKIASVRMPANEALEQADRLVLLARHRPAQLMTAALGADAFWQAEPGAVAATIRAALLRLPRAAEMPMAVDLLVQQATTLADWKRIAPAVRERVAALCRELQLPADAVRSDAALLPAVARAQEKVSTLRSVAATTESLQQRIRQLDESLARSVSAAQQTERQLKDEMLARSNTIDALRNELLERERAIASLRQDLGHRQGEVQRFVDHLAQQQQEILRLQENKAKLAVEVERLRTAETELVRVQAELARVIEAGERSRAAASAVEAEARAALEAERARSALALREAKDELAVLEQKVVESNSLAESAANRASTAEARAQDANEQLASLEAARVLGETAARSRAEELDRTERELATVKAKAEAATRELEVVRSRSTTSEARVRELEAMVPNLQSSGDELARKVQVLTEMIATFERNGHEQRRAVEHAQRERDDLRRSFDALREDRAQVAAQVGEIANRLREREEWIAKLLDEVQHRRVNARALLPHEAEFVARLRGAKSS